MTSEMRAKIKAADWRRATGIPPGEKSLVAGGGGTAAAVWSQLDSGH